MTQTTPVARPETQRLHGLDALRAGALGLGIVLHSLMPFLPVDLWPILDVHRSDAAIAVVEWIHLFRMVLFMLLAGFFGRMVLQRRGPGVYLRDRALRIGLPLVVLTPILMGCYLGAYAVATTVFGASPPPDLILGMPLWVLFTVPGHLWFLSVLMQCVLVTLAARAVLRRLVGPDRLTAAARRIGGVLAGPAGVAVAAVPYVAGLLLQVAMPGPAAPPTGEYTGGGIAQPISILPELPALTGFLGAFGVGWFLHAQPDALARIARAWPVQLGVALVSTVVVLVDPVAFPLVVDVAIVAVAGWSWTFALVGLSVRFLRRESPTMRYLADSSYWVYIAHILVLGVMQALLAGLDWPIAVKLLLTWAVCAVVLLLSYDLLVRGTWVGRWLGGRTHRPVLSRRTPTSSRSRG